ncbi:MAG TPA: carbohydrate ABC transporter permease [Bacteroidota bacterium]|jgi:ABC-type glycerol-3-phosphate transport system permease component|nr:carbohydrate ABC transporter permease [Bacteroidota bacterium]
MKAAAKYLILLLGAVIFAYPFLWMIAGSLKPELEISKLSLWSDHFSIRNFFTVISKVPVGRAFLNSLLVSLSVTVFVVLFGSMVGYALARLKFFGQKMLYVLILFTMMIPFQITLIPQYVMMVKLGLTDTYLSLIAPSMMSGLSILLFRQFFMSIPQSLIDAARLDGCSDAGILFRIIYPLAKPVIITVSILTFMTSWNDVLWPLIVVRDRSLMTMPQLVTIFVTGGEAESQLGLLLAAATLLALPVIIAYAFFQRYFIQSMASSGIKG